MSYMSIHAKNGVHWMTSMWPWVSCNDLWDKTHITFYVSKGHRSIHANNCITQCCGYGMTSIWPQVTFNDLWGQTNIPYYVSNAHMSIHAKNCSTGSFLLRSELNLNFFHPVISNDLCGQTHITYYVSNAHMSIHAKQLWPWILLFMSELNLKFLTSSDLKLPLRSKLYSLTCL